MSGVSGAAGAIAVADALIAQAKRAIGAIVELNPDDFQKIINDEEKPFIVVSRGGFIRKYYQYFAGCNGLVFYARPIDTIQFKSSTKVIEAKKITIPDL